MALPIFHSVGELVHHYSVKIQQLELTIELGRANGANPQSLRRYKVELETWKRARNLARRVRD